MIKTPAPQFDPRTAYHEAGHAVVALALGRPVHKVSVLPNTERLGACEFRKSVQRPSEDWVETEILISLAGMVAEARLTGSYDTGGADRDLRYVRKLTLMRASDRTVDRLEKRMLAKTENLLGDDELWQAVESIAKELLIHGQISGRAARHFYDLAVKSA